MNDLDTSNSIGGCSFGLAISRVPVIGEELAAIRQLADRLTYVNCLNIACYWAEVVAWMLFVESPACCHYRKDIVR